MRKILTTIALASFAAFALSACDKTSQPETPAAEAAPEVATLPAMAPPVAPVKPDVLVQAEDSLAAAKTAAASNPAAGAPAPVLDPAVADLKAKYDAEFAKYEAERKVYTSAWKKYLVGVVTANMTGVKSNHPYMYFVPSGDDAAMKVERNNQLGNVQNVVSRGVLPGNMMAFGGPDSKVTAQLIIDAFKDVQAGAFKDVVVLFVGARADADSVKQALLSSGADVRFVEAK